MVPTRRTRSRSRRSSILKPPKPRQPLQNLNFNSSSNESSPATTIKLKRRVSFAEKKHVKEFCNSLEQGTVWDSTYEEHDLSNIKVTFSSDKEPCNVESVHKEIEEADIINDFVNTHSEIVDNYIVKESSACLASNEVIQKDLTVADYEAPYESLVECTELACNPSTKKELLPNASSIIFHDEVEEANDSVLLTDVPLNSERCMSKSFTVYEDPNVNVFKKVVSCQESDANNLNCVKMNTTSILNTHMEFTEMISNKIYSNINCIERDKIEMSLQNTSLELTQVVPTSIRYLESVKPSQQDIVNLNLNTTQKYNDISMEMTTVVPTRPYNLQEDYYGIDKGIDVSQEVSMEMTEAIEMNTHTGLMQQDKVDDTLSLIKTIPQTKDDITRMDENSMEMTKAVNTYSVMGNNLENSKCINPYKKLLNFDKTVLHNDQEMEFTTAISTVIKMHSANLNLESDRTRIFHNNSMTITATISSANKMDTCKEEATITEPSIMELTEAVLPLQRILQKENSTVATSVIKQTISPKHVENRSFSTNSLNQTSVPDNVLRDITALVVPPSLNSSESPDKMDCTINNSEEDNHNEKLTKKTQDVVNITSALNENNAEAACAMLLCSESPDKMLYTLNNSEEDSLNKKLTKKTQDVVNITTNAALHVEQDTYASALNENNAEAACAMFNSVSNKSLHTVTSHTNENECLQHNDLKDIVSHPRRTYIIKPLSSDNSFINSLKECSKNPATNNDTEAKDNCSDQFLLENRGSFFNQSLEELESIKPPSFICLDDLSDEGVSANTNYNQEINTDKEDCSLLKSVETSRVTDCEETPKFSQEVVLEEGIDESRKCFNESPPLDDQSINSKSELNNQTRTCEVEQLQLSVVDDINMEIQDLNSSSSTIGDNERNSVYNIVSVPRYMNIQSNSNRENQSMEPVPLNRSDTCEEILEVHSQNDHLSDNKIKVPNDENVLNSMKEVVKESSEIQLSLVEKDITIELDPFSSLIKELRVCAQSDEIIWEVYHENIERKMFVIGFISSSLLAIIFLSDDCDIKDSQFIKDIKIISRLADDADDLISMVHRIILEKLDVNKVMSLYNTSETILSMLDYISKEVKLAMDFMFELKRLEDLSLMEITRDRISFDSYTKRMDIILRITMIIKPFEKIEPQDIFIHCLLGSVREEEIKKLIINIKRDHKFLRRYMSDVRDYVYLMEESASTTKLPF
ncbi:uncharacterized protein LOC116425689 [Nomia melanderi]|uniref:uncharacterized protein LOC116425689 n=1 Tax=Nomia melanderi TaxID=2448451 RepID=UPI003FCE1908